MATFVMNTNPITNQSLHTNLRTNLHTNLRINLRTNLHLSLHTSQLTNQPILLRNLILQRNHTTLRKSLIQQNIPNLSTPRSLTSPTILTKIPIPWRPTETAPGKHSTDTEIAEPGIRIVVRSNILEFVENIFSIKSTMMSADGKTRNNSFLCLLRNWYHLELRLKRNLVSNVTVMATVLWTTFSDRVWQSWTSVTLQNASQSLAPFPATSSTFLTSPLRANFTGKWRCCSKNGSKNTVTTNFKFISKPY